ncbi:MULTISPECIES: bifunctional 2-polyprenyl-6-hydroxyphenol methylase/3-demethylubiquinol 3-O-methyltransferase UbiG [Aestuariivivens]|uniref:class I SAM-dependent methyltransferase n=1 Tax=Aestuariivivens TaxID=1820275 RepID=UPI001CBFCC3C|nr:MULTISPECIES: methyltransferase domain-containing protein [Aestuariivivens]
MNYRKLISNPKPYLQKLLSKIINGLRVCFYKGNVVVCEICGWQGQHFFKGKCPKCNSLPRTRLVPFALKYFGLLSEAKKILHVAPNLNEYHCLKSLISKEAQYDRLNNRAVKHINIVEDLTKLTLPNDHYDLVIAWHVLEHIPNDLKAISNVYSILKSGGRFLVSVPIYPIDNETTFEDETLPYYDYEKIHGHDDHCRSCGLDYFKRFEAIGFKTKTLKVKDLKLDLINTYGLSNHHLVWCFTK